MKKSITFLFAVVSTLLASLSLAASPYAQADESRAGAIGQLMQTWQARILAFGLPVDDAKNWSRRNMAKFSRLNAERLALAQRASTLDELELALLDAPIPAGTHLDVLMANKPGDIAMIGARNVTKLSPATAPLAYAGLVFTAVTTCRILDSRVSQGGSGTWTAGSSNLVKIGPYATGYASGPGAQGGSATSCGLDTLAGAGQVAAILAAVSTVAQAGPGYLTFFPNGAPNPGTTSVSQWYQPGYVQTSFVLIPTDLVGTVAASGFSSTATEVIIDVVGYFIAGAGNANITLVQSTASAGNILKGTSRFIHNFGSQNTFMGENSGNFTMTGLGNTATGYLALSNNTTGNSNTASGPNALFNNTGGSSNTGSGSGVLFTNTTGTNNTASGVSALNTNTAGNLNTASGVNSLYYNAVGSGNTAMGTQALQNTTGSNNIALGIQAGFNQTTGSSNIAIGTPGVAGESSTIRLGNSAVHVRTFLGAIRGIATGVNDAIAVVIDSNGQLGTVSSSRGVKDDIADMDAASGALMKLRPVTFHYKSDQSTSGRRLQYGLIAEEVAEIYPGLVAHSADGQVETVMYQFLPSMLLNEYQKQQRTIEMQRGEMRQVVAELQTKTAEIAVLKNAVAEIAELKQQTAHLARLLEQQRSGALTAGLELK